MYNDFQILSNEEYLMINEKYNFTSKPDRKQQISKIYVLLYDCLYFCYSNKQQLPPSINEKGKVIYQKVLDNLASLCSIPTHIQSINSNFSVNQLLKKTTETIYEFQIWALGEEKEYYKQFSLNSQSELTKFLLEILKNLH